DIFRNTNNRPLGDVAQSITRIGDNYYVTLNNSRKIEVFDTKTFKSVETMMLRQNDASLDVIPMFIQHLGGDSIAVSDQSSSGKLLIMDIRHGQERNPLRRYVELNNRSFQMQLINHKLFVGGDVLQVFDLGNINASGMRQIRNRVGKTIQTVDFSKIVLDSRDRIWVLGHAAVYCIDPLTEQVIYEIDTSGLGINSWVSCIDISSDRQTLYFNSGRKVFAIHTGNPVAPSAPVFSYEGDTQKTIYAMAVSPENTLFFSEVLYGSLSRSVVYEFDPKTGKELRSFKAGIFSHYIYFE
ncbi:MAG: YncE family protein, partial [Bacteroidales bacterium]